MNFLRRWLVVQFVIGLGAWIPVGAKEAMLVTSIDEFSDDAVLEIFNFDTKSWRSLEKSNKTLPKDPSARAEALKPGSARLIEDHAVLEYELRNGLATELANYPSTLDGSAILEYGDTFCLVGGFDNGEKKLLDSVLCWNPLTIGDLVRPGQINEGAQASGGWIGLPKMTKGRHQPGAVVMDGKLFVAGGYDTLNHDFLTHVEVFDDVSQKWYEIAPLKYPRAGLSLVSLDGKIYAIGGYKNHEYLNVVEMYDPLMNSWKKMSDLNIPRAKFGAVVKANKIFAVGGVKGFRNRDNLKSVEVFFPKENLWRISKWPLTQIRGPVRATLVTDV
ncbi:hypothetical protein TCAL_01368 [Tigriopus californicus]|uniref:Uncharacterized protein n=1 Tax=Tigriopus californicus TaxID=6832 RepID=A0A553NSN7_TIGCA|nr:kelch-like protein 3 [Tigriopus californicus]TRY68430.1 hypothetical protein TCAL_01368 [Tigriopus californicus]|eukprot:TCALIF_01368-PA protein Name:"Similar to KLHL4 Kelch-like protein 4 (Homo sapiens)" AED:0.04 eAED:0.04 QI:0/-1/0/1/-1/1/1/0/330